MASASEVQENIIKVDIEGFGFLSSGPRRATVYSESNMRQGASTQTQFILENPGEAREFLKAFNPDMMVQLFKKEKAVAQAITTIAKSRDFGAEDVIQIRRVLEIGGDGYKKDKKTEIPAAIAVMERKIEERSLGAAVAAAAKGSAQNYAQRVRRASEGKMLEND